MPLAEPRMAEELVSQATAHLKAAADCLARLGQVGLSHADPGVPQLHLAIEELGQATDSSLGRAAMSWLGRDRSRSR